MAGVSIAPRGESAAREEQVVYSFTGDGRLGWSVRFVGMPLRLGGSGVVDVAGTCVLQVDFTGMTAAESADDGADVGTRSAPLNATEIVEVLIFPPRTGVDQSFIGVRSKDVNVVIEQEPDPARLTISFDS
ncbi:AMIN-like domain-containing (lipo)protein [Rhodococcus kronopolitis]|uniref:AMIN-like domain-containing protein n=1 Tax=Rhodococcus kronopolitis TaxID=1460226 RepID=A0ABV9FSX2_9NOCA